jgi:hypothetical protein
LLGGHRAHYVGAGAARRDARRQPIAQFERTLEEAVAYACALSPVAKLLVGIGEQPPRGLILRFGKDQLVQDLGGEQVLALTNQFPPLAMIFAEPPIIST